MSSLKFGKKTFLIIFEVFMVLLALCLIGGGTVMWQMNKGPIEVSFAKAFIESELSDPYHNISIRVGRVFLDWAALEARPQVTLKDVRAVNTKTDQVVLEVESAAVSVARSGLLLGHIEPRTFMVQSPVLTVVRDEGGSFRFSFEQAGDSSAPTRIDLNTQGSAVFALMDMLSKPRKDIPPEWPVRSLETVVISGAQLLVEDHVLQQNWSVPRFDIVFRRGDRSLVTTASLWLEDVEEKSPTLKVDAAYLGNSRSVAMDVAVNGLRTPFLAAKFPNLSWLENQALVLNGQAKAQINDKLALTGLEAHLQSQDGGIVVPGVYNRALPYKNLTLNIGYDNNTKTLSLSDSAIEFTDDFKASLSGSVVQKGDGDFEAPLKVYVDSLTQVRAAEFWPDLLKGDSSEDWALNRLSEGRVHGANIDLILKIHRAGDAATPSENEWSVALDGLKAGFDIENMTVNYSAPLMPVRQAGGRGNYDYASDRLQIDVKNGMLGELKIESGSVVIDKVTAAVGQAAINAHLSGPLKTVFQYIDEKPINVGDKIGTDISKIEGTADMKINVTFPTLADLPAEQIKVAATGTARDVLLPGLVSGLDLSGGPMEVAVKDGRLDVKGNGRLAGRDMDFTFGQFFESKDKPFSMQAIANITADPDLRMKFGVDLSDWMEGSVPVKIVYTEFGNGRTEVDADINATPAVLKIGPMNYTKPPGVEASASAKAILQGSALKEIRGLRVKTPDAMVEGGWMKFDQASKEAILRSGEFPKARLNESDVSIKFDITPQNVVAMSIQGPFLDIRPLLENNKKKDGDDYDGPALLANVSVARMRTADTHLVGRARISLAMDTKGEINRLEMDAVAGRGPLTFRYLPDAPSMKAFLSIQAQDAGAALQAFGVYENVRGGRLTVKGESRPGRDKHIIYGKAELTEFRVVNAPVLARLVNALSLPGILSLLGSNGIDFSRLESGFSWEKRQGVDKITISEGRTSGASLGLTFEGVLDRMADVMDVSGTIVPVSMVNSLIGNLPIVGDILTAGSGDAVFAATYTVRGPAKNPTTMVNPLAVLAPGFLRQIFFE